MGYRGKVAERERARELRAQAWTLNEIVAELGVSKSSVSLWVRDVELDESARAAKQAEIDRLLAEGRERIGRLSERELLIAGAALYAGEGSKRDGEVRFANCDARMIAFFCAWFRRFFTVDEQRLRLRLYLHQGLDLEAAHRHWSAITGIPTSQFVAPYRAVADASIRHTKHPKGCPAVYYASTRIHREVMGVVAGLLAFPSRLPG